MSVSLWCMEEEQEEGQDQGFLRAQWDPHASGQRVIQRLLQAETRYLPSPLYTALIQRDPQRREELTKWALEVCCECGCDEAVFPLTVSLLDRFLSASLTLSVSPFCLTAACVLLASKLTESDTVTADALCASVEYDFMPYHLREMERIVLSTLRWDVAAVTPQDFMPHFLSSLGEQRDGAPDSGDFLSTLRRHSDTLAAMCVCDSRFLGSPPSLVAAAAVNSALRGLTTEGPDQLAYMATTLAALCQTDLAVLQYYSDVIEGALQERLQNRGRRGEAVGKDEEVEDERAGTPTDLREIDF
ncbi:cyclin Dx [Clupea harengus]|uniref:Cyclin Dx n=1 Tax=Clupea harengus TaxID=7950 RepID=A0A6P3VST1_CLUHA|nr:cyclin Dx [Clupea harengus]